MLPLYNLMHEAVNRGHQKILKKFDDSMDI
jgi:hypothetical protein